MPVHVLLFDPGTDQEGIHSLEINGRTVVLLFEARDDAERYAGLLEAQDFPVPSVEALERSEMEQFCRESGYEARFVPVGFLPQTAEDRLLIAPPERNMDVHNWQEQALATDAMGASDSVRGGSARGGADREGSDRDGSDRDVPERAVEALTGDPELEAFRRQLEGLL